VFNKNVCLLSYSTQQSAEYTLNIPSVCCCWV